MYPPMLCFVLQGAKRVMIGKRSLVYRGPSYFLISVDLPASGQIIEASRDEPYMVVSLILDPSVLASLLIDMPQSGAEDRSAINMSVGE
jgi:hypothetical protein